ncbi:hypothetical protein NQZ68_015118, partial [Dissostichus eleginoides]
PCPACQTPNQASRKACYGSLQATTDPYQRAARETSYRATTTDPYQRAARETSYSNNHRPLSESSKRDQLPSNNHRPLAESSKRDQLPSNNHRPLAESSKREQLPSNNHRPLAESSKRGISFSIWCHSSLNEQPKKKKMKTDGCHKCRRQKVFQFDKITGRRINKGKAECKVSWLPCVAELGRTHGSLPVNLNTTLPHSTLHLPLA